MSKDLQSLKQAEIFKLKSELFHLANKIIEHEDIENHLQAYTLLSSIISEAITGMIAGQFMLGVQRRVSKDETVEFHVSNIEMDLVKVFKKAVKKFHVEHQKLQDN